MQPDILTYEPFFGLTEKPFSLNADPRFVYDSPTHTATRASLLAGIRRREGLHVLTGQIGSGKTTLCRTVLGDLGRNTYGSLVPDPFASREDLLKMLLIDFGVLSIEALTTGPLRQASRTELGYLLSEFLDALPSDAYVVVMIDEAQHLSLPLIEETRLLSDTFAAKGRLQIVFVGQPELHGRLKLPEMRQVDQRVCGYHRLAPMSRDAVAGYIHHRLAVAGGQPGRELFPAAIVDALHLRSGGVPRLINRVCDRALHLAYEQRAEHVDQGILDAALLEVGAVTLSPNWDSILFSDAAPVVPAPAAPPAPAAAAPAPVKAAAPPVAAVPAAAPVKTAARTVGPSAGERQAFDQEVIEWVAQELATPSRPLTSDRAAFEAIADDAFAQQKRRPAPKPDTSKRRVTSDWPRGVRSEPFIYTLMRTWLKWGAIALAGFIASQAILLGAIRLITGEAADPLSQPAVVRLRPLPSKPAFLDPSVALAIPVTPVAPDALVAPVAPAAPVAPVAPVAPAAPVAPVAPAEFLVAIGMFADHDRADRLADVLSQAGFSAMQRPVQLRQTRVQQLALGPFFSRAEATSELRRLQRLGGYDDARVIDGASK